MRARIGLWAGAALGLALCLSRYARGQTAPTTSQSVFNSSPTTQFSVASTEPTSQPASSAELHRVVVSSDLDRARDEIAPSLGAVTYTIGPSQIQNIPGGENASFQQVLLRAPGVVEDSFGQEHVRGEHANLTYRINGVLLPEPLNGFGQEIDTRLIDTVTLIDGSLPAQFGFHTAGVVDVTTKCGAVCRATKCRSMAAATTPFNRPAARRHRRQDGITSSPGHTCSDGIGPRKSHAEPAPDSRRHHAMRGFAYLAYHLDDTSRFSSVAQHVVCRLSNSRTCRTCRSSSR